jgi:DNA polymerase III delta prime subunit
MKYNEVHFDSYLNDYNNNNLHPKINTLFDQLPNNILDLPNLICYGPSGTGKYTQILSLLKKYSPSNLKYEKKISLIFNTQNYFFKISDIHYEIDMSLLGCNAKPLWHEFYSHIIDVLSAKPNKYGIIVAKNFQDTPNDLLGNFYSYMQTNINLSVKVIFFIITTQVSFIPDNILNTCQILSIPRPLKKKYTEISPNINSLSTQELKSITNIKLFDVPEIINIDYYKIIVGKILDQIISYKNIEFAVLRDNIYDIFIYNLDINNCIWHILSELIKKELIDNCKLSSILLKTNMFLKYYNNNYRPIYHVEKYILDIITIIHDF